MTTHNRLVVGSIPAGPTMHRITKPRKGQTMATLENKNTPSDASVRLNNSFGLALNETHRFKGAIELYLAWHEAEGHTKATIENNRRHLAVWQTWLSDNGLPDTLAGITSAHILMFLQSPKHDGTPRSSRYRWGLWQSLKGLYKWAVEWQLVDSSPVDQVKAPKIARQTKGFLNKEQIDKILMLCDVNSFTGLRRRCMVMLLLTSGLRHSELTSLMLADVDIKAKTIKVRQGKGQKDRIVPLHNDVLKFLLRYYAWRDDGNPNLWVTEQRRPLSYAGIATDFRRLINDAGLRGVVKDAMHSFRRTWAAQAVRQGIPRPYVMAVAGWSTPDMMDHYTAQMMQEAGAVKAFEHFKPLG